MIARRSTQSSAPPASLPRGRCEFLDSDSRTRSAPNKKSPSDALPRLTPCPLRQSDNPHSRGVQSPNCKSFHRVRWVSLADPHRECLVPAYGSVQHVYVEQPQNCEPTVAPRFAVRTTIAAWQTGHVGTSSVPTDSPKSATLELQVW